MIPFQPLKDRKLVQWALAYMAGAWALLQVADLVGDRFGWPDLWLGLLIVLLAVGFLAALVLAWYHGEKGRQRVSGPELLMLAGILVVADAAVMVVGRGSPADAAPGAEELAARLPSAPAPPAERSIAVLPFVDMCPEKDQEYFSDGITEELLNALAQVEGLRVAARTSSFSFKDKSLPVDSVGRLIWRWSSSRRPSSGTHSFPTPMWASPWSSSIASIASCWIVPLQRRFCGRAGRRPNVLWFSTRSRLRRSW
jgi:hypothetical protein